MSVITSALSTMRPLNPAAEYTPNIISCESQYCLRKNPVYTGNSEA